MSARLRAAATSSLDEFELVEQAAQEDDGALTTAQMHYHCVMLMAIWEVWLASQQWARDIRAKQVRAKRVAGKRRLASSIARCVLLLLRVSGAVCVNLCQFVLSRHKQSSALDSLVIDSLGQARGDHSSAPTTQLRLDWGGCLSSQCSGCAYADGRRQ